MGLIQDLRDQFTTLHEAKETRHWQRAMDLNDYVEGSEEKAEIELKRFTSDPEWLKKVRAELDKPGLSDNDRVVLEGWRRFFEANAIESAMARGLQEEMIEMESALYSAKMDAHLGYTDPHTGEHHDASSVKLRLMVLTHEDEAMRKAAWEGLREIEGWLLDHGLLDIFAKRNELARAVGYPDFYEWQVQINEGMSKAVLFDKLDELVSNTKDVTERLVKAVKKEHGKDAAEPWNFDHVTRGDLTKQRAPFLPFDTAVERWGRSFTALGVGLNGATLQLDLVDRSGKYENGFMHAPRPSFVDESDHVSAVINFTANAVPGQAGSGQRAIETLFHEGGHAAHFANIMMPAPCFGQEYAPTSIALAETQSMFMDNFIQDPDWLQRYARNHDGDPMPAELIHATVEEDRKLMAHQLRGLLCIPYFEKEIYEMLDSERTAERVLETARRIERKMSFQPGLARPILSTPHLQDNGSSAYYHAYILAQMAVYQLRAYFKKRDGHLLDNEKIGRDLAKVMWERGNEKTFLEYVKELTGEEFSAKATVDLVNTPLEQVHAEVDDALKQEASIPHFNGEVNLNGTIKMIHGDEVVANTETDGGFMGMADAYGAWIRKQEAAAQH